MLLRKTIEDNIIFPKNLQFWMIDGQEIINAEEIKIPEKEIQIEKTFCIQIKFKDKIEKIYTPLKILICDINCSIDLKRDHYSIFYENKCLEKYQTLLSYIENFDPSNIILEIKEKALKKVNIIIPNQSYHSNICQDYEENQSIENVFMDVIGIINLHDFKFQLYYNSQPVQKNKMLKNYEENQINFELEIISQFVFYDKKILSEVGFSKRFN